MKKYMATEFKNLRSKQDLIILAIESSCDETAVSVVKNGREVLSNVISSQIDIHRRFSGVVPEIASRNHLMAISNLYDESLKQANIEPDQIDAIAVTYGAGLMGALLVGVNFAKGLSYSLQKPLIAVNHVHGHIASNYITHKDLKPPFLCLMVSGGHTAILRVSDYTKFKMLGSTVDDAVGEAFDKVARVLSLPYPGGPEIDKLAKQGKNNIKFTVSNSLKSTLNFSFSGIKTAVINCVHNKVQKNEKVEKADVARSFEECVTDELTSKVMRAMEITKMKKVVVAGGVGANSMLQEKLKAGAKKIGGEAYFPELKYCTDNAAMIGSVAYYYIRKGIGKAELDLTARPTIEL